MDRVGYRFRLWELGNMKRWTGNRVRGGIISGCGVRRENDNGRRVVEFCSERGL